MGSEMNKICVFCTIPNKTSDKRKLCGIPNRGQESLSQIYIPCFLTVTVETGVVNNKSFFLSSIFCMNQRFTKRLCVYHPIL